MIMSKINSKHSSKPFLVKRGLGEFVFLFFAFVFLLLQPFFIQAQSYVAVTTGSWYDPALYPDDPEDPESKLSCGHQVKPFPVDWDDDGDMDVLVGNSDGTICYFANNGDDTFEKFENFGGFDSAFLTPYAIDWDDDGDQDIIMGMGVGDVNYYANIGSTGIDGGNTFDAADTLIDLGVDAEGLQPTLVDWEEDGFYDIVVGTSDGNLVYISNNGANVFSETDAQWQGIDFGSSASPNIVDFNGDGFLDVVVGSGSEINLIINSGDNLNFTVTEEYIPGPDHMLEGESPKFLYWDEDSHLDILMGYNGYIVLYLNDYDSDTYVGSDDCNNEDAAINIAAAEVCDSIDNDCDGEVDEDNTSDGTTYYADTDEDGFGDANTTIITCDATAPTGYTTDNTDCDDNAATANPDGTEVCDELDNDCNGDVDESTATDATEWYQDSDGDGLGNTEVAATSCNAPTGFIAADSETPDCDDTDAALTTDCPAADDDDTTTSGGGCSLQSTADPHTENVLAISFSAMLLLALWRSRKLTAQSQSLNL
jgi:hypothetical protein